MLYHRQSNCVDRASFGLLLNKLGLINVAVEVGTHRGDFAKQLMDRWSGNRLHCVDPWCDFPGYEGQAETLQRLWNTTGNREDDYQVARLALARHTNRVQFLKRFSVDAARSFQDRSLDFVYIDGDHRYEAVKQDLYSWWPKVRQGGILAFHDYLCHGPDDAYLAIQKAVFELAQDHKLTELWLVVETRCEPWSGYFIKP